MKIKRLIVFTLLVSLVLNSSANISYAKVDMTHDYYEEGKVASGNSYYGACHPDTETCNKYLFRYEDIDDVFSQLKNLSKNASAKIDKEKTFWYPWYQKLAIGAIGFLGIIASFKYISAAILFLFMTMFVLIKCENSEEFKNDLLKRGLIEKIRECIFGDKTFTIITAEEKQTFYTKILNEFCKKVENKEWENNDILILSTDQDPKDMRFGIRFGKTAFKIDYNKPVEEYFKNIK